MGTLQIALIGGLAMAFLISNAAFIWLRRATAGLETEVQERLWRKENRAGYYWRTLEYAGIALLLCGFLLPMRWSYSNRRLAVAVGLILICAGSVVRAWLSRRNVNNEAPDTPVSRSAFKAAVVVTCAESLVAAVACAFILAGAGRVTTQPDAAVETPAAITEVWLSEKAAVEVCPGINPDYLRGLGDSGRVKQRTLGESRFYSKHDLEAVKAQGYPKGADATR